MTPKKELQLAYALAVILLVVGAVSYAYYPVEEPEQPLRVMYKSVAGKVLFDHQTHLAESGYGISCLDCHHHPQDEESPDLRACGDCHHPPTEDEPVPVACMDCHDSDEVEDSEMGKSADAFHEQCMGCHNEYEAGPVDCSGCHVL